MMLIVDGVERECQICPAPQGTFCIINYGEGGYFFPRFVAVAREGEPVVACPLISGHDRDVSLFGCGGSDSLTVTDIDDELGLWMFKRLLVGSHLTFETTIEEAVRDIVSDFVLHGVILRPDVKDYVESRGYIGDEELKKIEEEWSI